MCFFRYRSVKQNVLLFVVTIAILAEVDFGYQVEKRVALYEERVKTWLLLVRSWDYHWATT